MNSSSVLQVFDYIVIAGYFVILVSTSFYFSKRMTLSADFFTAGGNMPWWLAGISFFMASHSALSFVMYGELGYKYGISAILLFQTTLPALIFAGIYVAKRWRRSRTSTPVQFLEKRYSLYIRQALAWTGFPLRIIDDALKIFSTAIFLFVGMKLEILSLSMVIGLVGGIITLYAVLGGQRGVIITDFLQFIIKMVIVIVVFILSFLQFFGSPDAVASLPPTQLEPFSDSYRLLNYVAFLALMTVSMNTAWGMVQKYNTVRNERDAQRVAWTVTVLNFVAPIIFFAPAIIARSLLPGLPEPKYTYAELAFSILPTGMMGMLVAGMFASTIATMGSEFNVLAGILTNDLYKRVFKENATDKELMAVGRAATIVIGLMIITVAILISVLKGFNLFDIMLKAFGALMPATALPILLGFFWKRITARGALTGLIVGAISGITLVLINVTLINQYAERLQSDVELQYWLKQGWDSVAILVNIAVTIIAMYIGSLFRRNTPAEQSRVDSYFLDLQTPIADAPAQGGTKAHAANLQVMGAGTVLFGLLMASVGILLLIFGSDTFSVTLNLAAGAIVGLFGFLLYRRSKG